MVNVILRPAPGALCGEHYVHDGMNHDILGVVHASRGRGRPRVELRVAAGSLLLQRIADLLDENEQQLIAAAEDAARKNREWERANGYSD